jgi:uncharacterized protein (TIGR02246 family)
MSDLAPGVEATINDLLRQLSESWQRGDGAAFGAPFAEDAEYITATGDHLHGRQAIAELHQRIFDGIFKNSRLGGQLKTMRCISPDVVLVQSVGGILFAGEADSAVEPNGIATTVIAKQEGTWRIVSFQNTPTGRHRRLRFLFRILKSRMRGGSVSKR